MPVGERQADPAATAFPTKCASCEALLQVPSSCEDCHQLLAHVQGADYFEVFGQPRRYELDLAALEEKYLAISRNIHPDKYAVAGPEMQAFALRASAAVNQAYDVLRDPIHRAEYLLESAGGPSATQNKQVPPDMLGHVMTLREEIEQAKAEGDEAALEAIRERLLAQRRGIERRIAALCRDLDAAGEATKNELRVQLNAMKYVANLLGHI
jgi:molecular chaperone HscB